MIKIKYTCYIFNFNINYFNIILYIYLKYMTKVKRIIKGIVRTINDDTYLKSIFYYSPSGVYVPQRGTTKLKIENILYNIY